ncbi:MAG: anti-sigma factor [Pseudobacteriovorax sp.]|nr:anti-sigma factor [Pseudobacteriovorax sp.]
MKKTWTALVLSSALLASACGDDDDNNNTTTGPASGSITLSFTNLPELHNGLLYEGWAIVDGEAISTGVFNVVDGNIVDGDGNTVANGTFTPDADISDAEAIVISIEPANDTDPAPAATHIVSGAIANGNAALTTTNGASLASDFADASGKYLLKTPTDGDDAADSVNERSGIWFLGALPPEAGLVLPELPDGWKYEGWAVTKDGIPLSTGTFTQVDAADDAELFSTGGPAFPGEDFLTNAPEGLSFPLDLRSGKAVISIEPSPDDSPLPFAFKPLVGDIAADASSPTIYNMENNAAASILSVTGTAIIN